MENQDHRATVSSGHASHGVHLCHKCGWPFPNPHPSAKHRRAHKKVCGTIEGYKLTESEATPLAISDDEHPSDDDRRTPSPKVNNKSFKEAAASFKSTRSEDELFSDAMTEFSDSGHHNPVMDEGLEAAIKLGKHAQKFPGGDELPKVDAPTDASKPLDDPLKTSQLGDPQLLGSAVKPLDAFGSKSKEDSIGLNEPSGQQLDVAPILENVKATDEEVLMSNDRKGICVQENEHANAGEVLADAVEPSGDIAPLQSRLSEPDSVKTAVQEGEEKTSSLSQKEVESVEADSKVSSSSSLTPELFEGPRDTPEHLTQGSKAVESVEADFKMSSSSSLEPELVEEGRDAPGHIILGSKSVEAENKVSSSSSLEPELLEGARDTPEHIVLESKSNGEDVKISCPPDQKSDQCQADGNASEVVSLDRKLEPSDELETKMGGKDESGVFLQASPLEKTDTEDIEGRSSQNDFVELCKTEVEEKEDVQLLSEAKDISSLHNAELAVQEFKDYKYLKSNLALDLGAGDEGISSAQDDVKPDQSLLGPPSILDASGDDIRKDDGKVPIEGKIDLNGSSEVINDENLGSSISVPATLESTILTFEPTNSHSTEDESSQQCKPLAHSDENSIAPCMLGEVGQIIPTILDASGDDISKDDSKVPIEGKIDPEGSKVIYEEISVSAPTTLENLDPTKDESSQNSFKQCKQLGDSDNNSIAPSMGDEVRQTITPGGSETFYDCAMDKTKMSFPAENESRETQTPDSFGGDDHPDLEKSGSKCLDVERSRSMEETEGKMAKVTGGGAEDYQTGHSLGVGNGSLHDKARTEVPDIAAGSEHRGEDAKDKMVNIEPKHDSSVTALESTNAAGDDERNHENVEHISSIPGKHADVDLQEKPYEGPTFSESASLPVDLNSGNSATVENKNIVDVTSTSEVGSVPLKGEGDDKTTKQQDGVTAVDMSVASSSGTDSLDANWGSVSVISIQSETTGTAPVDGEVGDSSTQKTEVERNPDKNVSDTFEPPSFMTLVESGSEIENAQHPKSDSLKAGWFPSLNNVVNESQGRKKNEEIIAKVTNWSTGKQHTPLINLLGEAKSPNTKQVPQKDETTAATATTTVNSILSSEPTAPKEAVEKEWDSPARYPVGIKKEKKKGKAYWVPFVCCSSVH